MPTFPRTFPRRGEIYWAPAGTKVRPVVVVSAEHGNNHSDSIIAAATTTNITGRRFPVNVFLPENDPLPRPGLVLCRSLYVLPKADIGEYRCDLRPEQMEAVNRALLVSLGLPR